MDLTAHLEGVIIECHHIVLIVQQHIAEAHQLHVYLIRTPVEIGLEVLRDPGVAVGVAIHDHLLRLLYRGDDRHHLHLLRGVHTADVLAGERAVILIHHDQLRLLDYLGIVEGGVEEGVDDRDEKEE